MRKGIAAIWAVLITVIVLAGLGGGAWYYLDLQNTKDKDVMNKQILDLEKQVKDLKDAAESKASSDVATEGTESSATSDPYLYSNSTYGFSLRFNSKWQGYQIKNAITSGATATYYICLPTTDANYAQASSTSLAATASVFAIGVYNTSEWETISAEEGAKPTKIGESGDWTIAYSPAQAYPGTSVFSAAASDVKNVVATFTAL